MQRADKCKSSKAIVSTPPALWETVEPRVTGVLQQQTRTVFSPREERRACRYMGSVCSVPRQYAWQMTEAYLDAGKVADVHHDDRQPLAVLRLQSLHCRRALAAHCRHYVDALRQQLCTGFGLDIGFGPRA